MLINRREFARIGVRSVSAVGLAGAFSRFGLMNAFAQTPAPGYRALVCIFLYGGNDGNNTIIPVDVSPNIDYQNMRGGPSGLALTTGLHPLQPTSGGAHYAFHPSLGGLANLYNQNPARVAAVLNVGPLLRPTPRTAFLNGSVPVPANLFSHSDQQSQAQTFAPNSFGTTGWAGRAADAVSALNAGATYPPVMSVSGAPVFCNGQATIPAAVMPGPDPRTITTITCGDAQTICAARATGLQQVLQLNSGLSLVQAASDITGRAIDFGAQLNAAVSATPQLTTTFPQTSLGFQLRQVAQVISARNQLGLNRQIFFCSLGGFDNHSNQLADHANLLTIVNDAMVAFYQATVALNVSGAVTTFLMSEFGRTMGMNAGLGSDHAWGSHLLVMGDSVRGGDTYGTFPTLAGGGPDDCGATGRWIPTMSFDQYGATLANWFGVPAPSLNTVFPNLANFTVGDIGFML
jgi:uncharacterized protein (DUF1501 family)